MNALLVEFARYQNEFLNLAGLLLGLLKSSAILVMALAAATVLGKRSARARSWVWRTAFLGLGALWLSSVLPAGTPSNSLAWKVVPMQAAAKTDAFMVETPTILESQGTTDKKAAHSGASFLGVVNRFCLPIWWGMAGLLATVHLVKVLAGGAWLRDNSKRAPWWPVESGDLEIRLSDKVDAPLLAGLFRPAIYLPAAAGDWPEAKLRDVVRHEMAHHSRGDLWWQFSAMMISSLWWGNPLVWTAVRSLKAEAEEAADDVVVQQKGTAEEYARLLVEIASGPIRPASTGISMLGCSPLEKRIRAILTGNPQRGTIGVSGVALLSSLAAFIILSLSAGIVLAEVDLTNREGEVVHYQANPEKTVFSQGNFRVTGGTLKDWTGDLDKASSPQRGLVRLSAGDAPSTIETVLPVDPSWKWLTVIARTRPGGEGKFAPDQQGEVIFTSEDANGKQTGSAIALTDARRDGYTNWTSPMRTFAVPPGTAKLKVGMRLTPGSSTFDCSEIFVIPSYATDELDHRTVDRFFDAVKANDAATVESMLKAEPKLANSRRGSNDNGTPLTLCAWKELPEMASLLVKNGANLESEDTGAWRSTPLAWCGWWGSPKTAQILLEAGANAKFTSDFGVTPLSSAKAGKGANRSSKATPEDYDKVIALFAGAQK